MARRSYSGGAVPTATTSLLNPTDLSVNINDDTGWPTGGGSGEFIVIINPGLPNEEHALASSLSGGTISFANVAKRGVDNTSAGTHPIGSVIIHGDAALEADEANRHINDPAQAVIEHSTLLDAARHAAIAHSAAMLGTDSVGTDEIAANAVTASEIAANAVTTAKILDANVTTAKIADLNVTSGKIADLGVTTGKINDLAVTAAKIAANTITAGQIANDTITATQIAANAITASELADNAVDTNAILAAAVTLAKLANEDPTNYAPSEGAFSSLGTLDVGPTGTTYGYYFRAGRLAVGWAGFVMDSNGNVPSGNDIRIPVPFNQKSLTTMRGFVAARARLQSGLAASGTGVITAGTNFGQGLVTAGASATWDATTPFNWGNPGDGPANVDSVWIMVADV